MALALTLGRRGRGKAWPNPAVGCVIVKAGRVLGRGWTQPGGRPHAETVALAQAGAQARGATAYVTLEPCAHHGRTPPCTDALIAAGIARVVAALRDPDPRVDGGGFARLSAAGIAVEHGLEEAAARSDHAGYLQRITQGRPWLTLKLATSLDGRIATATGESRWITGAEARRRVHGLRASHDAVLVGAGTARADDPDLTIRDMGVAHQPVRVVVSRRLDLPRDSRLARTADTVPVWLVHGGDADPEAKTFWENRGARLIAVPAGSGGQIDPGLALAALGTAGLTRVLCEGGGTLAASLLGADLVDELVCFGAGLALGAEGKPAIGAMGIAALAEAPHLVLADLRAVGGDVMQVWQRRTQAGD